MMQDPKKVCSIHGGHNEGLCACQFFEIGIGRVASRSLCAAARQLGLRAKHGLNGCGECEKDAVKKIMYGQADFDLYKTCIYSGDFPFAHWRQVHKQFPKAKFILPIRQVEDWLDSFERTKRDKQYARLARKGPIEFKHLGRLLIYGQVEYDRDVWRESFNRYKREVIGTIERSRLLILNAWTMSDGELWKKLADFTGRSSPRLDFPFPVQNKRLKYLRPTELL